MSLNNQKNILLVEGEGDRVFFEAIINDLLGNKPYDEDKVYIRVAKPKDINNDGGNGKGNAIALLPKLIEQLKNDDDPLKRLSVVLDADFSCKNKNAVENTLIRISTVLKEANYFIENKENIVINNAFIFKHINEKFPNINIWIMPNNKDDGYLEYFIKDNIIENKKDKLQASLFEYAIDCFSKIPDKQAIQHRDIDKSKSEIATWLAFQKKPQYSLAAVVNLIDFTQHTAKNLMDWLKDTFPKTENL